MPPTEWCVIRPVEDEHSSRCLPVLDALLKRRLSLRPRQLAGLGLDDNANLTPTGLPRVDDDHEVARLAIGDSAVIGTDTTDLVAKGAVDQLQLRLHHLLKRQTFLCAALARVFKTELRFDLLDERDDLR